MRLELLRTLDRVLGEASIPALAVKGLALALSAYPVPWERPMSDIDLLMHEPDLARACSALDRAGWSTQATPGRPLTTSLLETVVVPPAPHPPVPVELHASMDKVVPRDLGMTDLFARSRLLPGARWIRIPSSEDHLILISLHLASDEFRHPAGFVDLEVLLECGVNFEAVVNRANRWRAATPVHLALASLDQLRPALVPSSVIYALRPARFRLALLRRAYPAPPHPQSAIPGSTRLGLKWLVMQTLLRDDPGAWFQGVARYAVLRGCERLTEWRDRGPG